MKKAANTFTKRVQRMKFSQMLLTNEKLSCSYTHTQHTHARTYKPLIDIYISVEAFNYTETSTDCHRREELKYCSCLLMSMYNIIRVHNVHACIHIVFNSFFFSSVLLPFSSSSFFYFDSFIFIIYLL